MHACSVLFRVRREHYPPMALPWCEQAKKALQEGAWPRSWHHSHSASSQGGARAAAAARGTKGRVQTER